MTYYTNDHSSNEYGVPIQKYPSMSYKTQGRTRSGKRKKPQPQTNVLTTLEYRYKSSEQARIDAETVQYLYHAIFGKDGLLRGHEPNGENHGRYLLLEADGGAGKTYIYMKEWINPIFKRGYKISIALFPGKSQTDRNFKQLHRDYDGKIVPVNGKTKTIRVLEDEDIRKLKGLSEEHVYLLVMTKAFYRNQFDDEVHGNLFIGDGFLSPKKRRKVFVFEDEAHRHSPYKDPAEIPAVAGVSAPPDMEPEDLKTATAIKKHLEAGAVFVGVTATTNASHNGITDFGEDFYHLVTREFNKELNMACIVEPIDSLGDKEKREESEWVDFTRAAIKAYITRVDKINTIWDSGSTHAKKTALDFLGVEKVGIKMLIQCGAENARNGLQRDKVMEVIHEETAGTDILSGTAYSGNPHNGKGKEYKIFEKENIIDDVGDYEGLVDLTNSKYHKDNMITAVIGSGIEGENTPAVKNCAIAKSPTAKVDATGSIQLTLRATRWIFESMRSYPAMLEALQSYSKQPEITIADVEWLKDYLSNLHYMHICVPAESKILSGDTTAVPSDDGRIFYAQSVIDRHSARMKPEELNEYLTINPIERTVKNVVKRIKQEKGMWCTGCPQVEWLGEKIPHCFEGFLKKATSCKDFQNWEEECYLIVLEEYEKYNKMLHTHHVDVDLTNNSSENLQTLCPNAHSAVTNEGNHTAKRYS